MGNMNRQIGKGNQTKCWELYRLFKKILTFSMIRQHLFLFSEKNKWKIPTDPVVPKTASRYGHSALAVNRYTGCLIIEL